MSAIFRVRFSGLCTVIVPPEDEQTVRIRLPDVTTPFRPLGIATEDPLDRHVGFLELRPPLTVNGMDLLGTAVVPLRGARIRLKTGRTDGLTIDRDGSGVRGLINVDKIVSDCSLDAQPDCTATVKIAGETSGKIYAGRPATLAWSISRSLVGGGDLYTENFANSFYFEPQIDQYSALRVVVRKGSGKNKTKRVYDIESLAGQDVDIAVCNLCGPLPSFCGPVQIDGDPDFRAHYELLSGSAKQKIRDTLSTASDPQLPYPFSTTFTEQRPCYVATIPR